MRKRGIAAVTILISALAVGAWRFNSTPTSLPALMRSARVASGDTSSGKATELWLIFRPSTCTLRVEQTRSLSALNAVGRVHVFAVMTHVPEEQGERAKVLNEFELKVPLLADDDGKWQRALDAAGISEPLYILREGGRTVAMATPSQVESAMSFLKQYAF